MHDVESGFKHLDDLVRPIDVLALDEPSIRLLIPPFKNALRGDSSGQAVSRAAFTGNYYREDPFPRITQPAHLCHGRREIRQVFKDMNGQDTVEAAVGKLQSGLAVADDDSHPGEPCPDLLRHVLAELQSVIIVPLLFRERFVRQMFAVPGADLERSPEASGSVADRVAMVEIVDHPVTAR